MKGTNGKGTWDPMQYFYAILWFAVGLILIFSLSKENRIFLFAGGFFLLLGAWWLADALLPEVDLFAGAMVELGRKHGIPTPYSELMLHGIRVREEKNAGTMSGV